MVSRDFIKGNKRNLRIKEIKGDMLKHWQKTGQGRNKRRKLLLVGKEGEEIIKKREYEEILMRLSEKKFKTQKNIIDKGLLVAKRAIKGKLENEMGIEFSSDELSKLAGQIKSSEANKKIVNYVKCLAMKRKEEEQELKSHKQLHEKTLEFFKKVEQNRQKLRASRAPF